MSDTGVGGESQVAGTRIDTLNRFVAIVAVVWVPGGFLFWFYGLSPPT